MVRYTVRDRGLENLERERGRKRDVERGRERVRVSERVREEGRKREG
jgi:hypothetical protein